MSGRWLKRQASDRGQKIAAISSWQGPQEAIEPRYLPPFLLGSDRLVRGGAEGTSFRLDHLVDSPTRS